MLGAHERLSEFCFAPGPRSVPCCHQFKHTPDIGREPDDAYDDVVRPFFL